MKMSFEIAARTRQAKWAICCSCRECNSNSSSRRSNKKVASGEAAGNGGDLRFLAVRASDKGRGAQCPKRSLITGTSSGCSGFLPPFPFAPHTLGCLPTMLHPHAAATLHRSRLVSCQTLGDYRICILRDGKQSVKLFNACPRLRSSREARKLRKGARRGEAGVRVGGLLAAWLALQLMRTQRYHLAFL